MNGPRKKVVSFLTAFCLLIVLEGPQIACTTGQTYLQIATPAISREQAVQLALQEAETLNLTPFFGGGPIVHQVDSNPSNVTFFSSSAYPKWLITFNAMFYWPMGHCPGAIQVQVAADTGKIDNTTVTKTPTDESTPTALPSQTPTPTITPTPTPTKTATPFPTATSQSKENSPDFATTLISIAVIVIIIASIALAFLFRWKKHSE